MNSLELKLTINSYEQHKYNLFKEESEGYSKLLVQLLQMDNKTDSAIAKGNVDSLIGYFDLDPNRVIDIMLECFSHNPNCGVYADLLSGFRKEYIPHILGFRFSRYSKGQDLSKGFLLKGKSLREVTRDHVSLPTN